ncbi:MAG: hypothetical protein ACRETC_01590 [Gammaproteobacteria bacterium]
MKKMMLLPVVVLAFSGCHLSVNTALGPNVARARAQNAPVLIYAIGVPGQISVPGSTQTAAPVFVQFLVTGKRPIKQIRFALRAYSQRGQPVRNRNGSQLQMILIGPGVFNPDKLYEVNSFNSRPAGFPGGSVACVELRQMIVTYTAGDSRSFTLPRLDSVLTPQLRGGCGDRGPSVNDLLSDRTN